MRPRTVAIVAPYYPPKIGGVERYAEQLARAVADDPALTPVVITTRLTGLRTRVGTQDGVTVVRLGAWMRLSNTPFSPLWPLQMRYWLRRTGADVVNAHAPVPGLADIAVMVAGRRHTVLTYHSGSMVKGTPSSRLTDRLLTRYERHVLPRVFSRAGTVVAVSPVSLAAGRPDAVEISPGVDIERFTPADPPSARPRTLLYVGRMDRSSAWKGVDVLIRAFAEPGLPDGTRLRLVGGGDALPDLLALAERLGVADRVEAPGELTGADLVEAMRTAAVLVLPSLTEAESFGMTLVEAMACGTPVVGSAVGGIPHVVVDGEQGLLVPPGDEAALAAACRTLLGDPELADRMGAAGRRRAVDRYAWPTLTNRYRRIFRGEQDEQGEPGTHGEHGGRGEDTGNRSVR